ncbi:hypothetical protein RRF57_000199 [Xylaria bambusicola]|uniref:Uncharacterized protein n=1 Tax=Xylaria bambusicola TaxID=326684 RepID=A0AAN7UAB5_9PEZI
MQSIAVLGDALQARVVTHGDRRGGGVNLNEKENVVRKWPNSPVSLRKEHEQLDEHLSQRRRRLDPLLLQVLRCSLRCCRLGTLQQQVPHLFRRQNEMREIKRHERRLRGEDGVVQQRGGRLGIYEHVELGPLRVIPYALDVADAAQWGGREAVADTATHHTHACHVRLEVRVCGKQLRDVGQRPRAHDPRRAGLAGSQRGRHGVDGGHGCV